MQLQTNDFISDLKKWQHRYMNWMQMQDYSKNTLELYDRVVKQFVKYSLQYQDEMSLKDIRSTYFSEFVSFLEREAYESGKKQNRDGKYLSKSTKDAYMKAIKSYFTYISDNNDDLYTFDRYFRNAKIRDKSKPEEKMKHLTDSEVEGLLNQLKEDKANKDDYNSYRNSLLIKLMLHAGLRISEALAIRLQDFSTDEDENIYLIQIFGKGAKEQTGYILKQHIQEEINYFIEVAKLDADEFIMRTKNNARLDRRSAFTIVNRIYSKANISKKGLHILRHTLAMHLTNMNVNPLIIKKMLRHASISTTTIYAKASNSSISKALKTT